MFRLRSNLLLAVLMAACLAQEGSQLVTPDIRRVGQKLACLCGSCKNTVGNCPMLECHYAKPAREKIARMQAASKGDGEIVNAIVKEQGLQALSAPPAEGFSLLAWVLPFAALALGLYGLLLFMKRIRRGAAVQAAPEIDPAVLERYREAVEKETANLDQ